MHSAGGDVLKLMADGVLAIFTGRRSRSGLQGRAACRGRHAAEARQGQPAPRQAGQPVSSIYLGLHIGDVFYGNIGSKDRLDFTVVGQAVNEASRIASMCRSADRDVLFSSAFHQSLARGRPVKSGLGRPLRPARCRPRAGAVHAGSGDCVPSSLREGAAYEFRPPLRFAAQTTSPSIDGGEELRCAPAALHSI